MIFRNVCYLFAIRHGLKVTKSLSIQFLSLGMFYTENHTIGPLLYVITRNGKCYFTMSMKMEAMNSKSGERQLDRFRDSTIRH